MPAIVLTITAVDHTTGKLTSTAHGLNTGDGPGALFAQPGSVIPTGLAGATDYYAIRIDANTFQLASSSANALANIPVTFSTNGTTPLLLLKGIPYRRTRTSAPGTQVFSDDINSMQDALEAIFNLLTGQAQTLFNNVTFSEVTLAAVLLANAGIVSAQNIVSNQDIVINGSGSYKRGAKVRKIPVQAANFSASNGFGSLVWSPAANGNVAAIPLVVQEGERITQVAAKVSCGTSATFTLQVFRYDPATQTSAQLGSTATSAGHSNVTENLVVGSINETVSSSNAYNYTAVVTVTAFSSGMEFHGAELTTDAP